MTRHFASFIFALFLFAGASILLAEEIREGDPAPGFELKDQDGQLHSLEDYRDKWVAVGSLWKKSPVRFGKLWRLAEMPFAVNER
jgi:hypothetical protein